MRFRKSFKIAPGIRINLSKSGASTTIGGKGASVNIGKTGTYLNTGIPGTGLYNREKISGNSNTLNEEKAENVISTQSQNSPFFRHLLLGTLTLGMVWFGKNAGAALPLFGIFMLYRFIFHITRKTKPVYGEKAIYKQDRRYKSGHRIEGFQKVKTGTEPLTDTEILQHKKIGYIRATFALILWVTFIWILISQ